MTEIAPTRRGFMHALAEHNPFYFISAACMLGGCLALTNSLSWSPITHERLLTLIATLNVYEFTLILLAIYLARKRGQIRDARMLLGLEAFFLVDVTFLNAEIANDNFQIGAIINAILFILAIIKLWLIFGALKPELGWRKIGSMSVQLAVLFTLPSTLCWLDRNAVVSPRHLYVAWWLAALLPGLHYLLNHRSKVNVHHEGHLRLHWSALAVPAQLYLLLPWFSLVLHTSILHYVYNDTFQLPMLAPVLLGLAFLIPVTALRIALPVLAVLASSIRQAGLGWEVGYLLNVTITPFLVAIAGSYLVIVCLFLARYAVYFLSAGMLAGGFWLFGPTMTQIGDVIQAMWNSVTDFLRRLVPRTRQAWGMISVAAAFAFLGIGALVSIRKEPNGHI